MTKRSMKEKIDAEKMELEKNPKKKEDGVRDPLREESRNPWFCIWLEDDGMDESEEGNEVEEETRKFKSSVWEEFKVMLDGCCWDLRRSEQRGELQGELIDEISERHNASTLSL